MPDSTPAPFSDPTQNDRRTLLRTAAGLVLAWLTPIRAQAQPAEPTVAVGDLLVRVGDPSLIPITPDDVPFDGRALLAWPLSGDTARDTTPLNKIIVARLNPAGMSEATRARAVDDIVAYSAICTHSGCDVDESIGESQTLYCGCHGSTFDPRDSGLAIGGPAPRALPPLPLKLEGGRLAVAATFVTPPGFGR
jgi:rieske iron-sulfur protein